MNFNVLAMLEPGSQVTIKTVGYFSTEDISKLKEFQQRKIIKLLSPVTKLTPNLCDQCTFEICSGFSADKFIKVFGNRLAEMTTKQIRGRSETAPTLAQSLSAGCGIG